MKKNLVELVFILDRSGSMAGLENDTIGGFNSLIEKQKKEKGRAIITTVLFDHEHEILHNRIDIKGVKTMTDKDYFVRGSTALLDSLGNTISKTLNTYKNTHKFQRPQKVMFVIITDGLENASNEYNYSKVKELINNTKEKYNWEYMFLGANIDAEVEASKFGIDSDRAVTYNADSVGTQLNYSVMTQVISDMRSCKEISADWKEEISKDFKNRK